MDEVISELRMALVKCRQSIQGYRAEESVVAQLRAAEDKIQLSIGLLEEHAAHAAAR